VVDGTAYPVGRHCARQPSLHLIAGRSEGSRVRGERFGADDRQLGLPERQIESGAKQSPPQLVTPPEGMLHVGERTRLGEKSAGSVEVSGQEAARSQVK
jgi:hypothetical protein